MPRRVQIKQKDQGDEHYYTFPVNPLIYQNLDFQDMHVSQTVDGFSYENLRNHDGRIRTMRWEGLPNKAPFNSLVSFLKNLIGSKCHIKLNYLAGTGLDNTSPKLVRIIDVKTEFAAGLGPKDATSHMIYSSIELTFVLLPPE